MNPRLSFIYLPIVLAFVLADSARAVTAWMGAVEEDAEIRLIAQISYVPSKENLGGIVLGLQLKQGRVVKEAVAEAPSDGPWSQVSPEIQQASEELRFSAIAPAFLGSRDTLRETFLNFTVRLDTAGGNLVTLDDVVDSVWIIKSIDPKGDLLEAELTRKNDAVGVRSPLRARGPAGDIAYRGVRGRHSLRFSLAHKTDIEAIVLDAQGKTISLLHRGVLPKGFQTVVWDAKSVPAGTYFISLKIGTLTYHKKVSIIQ